MVVGFWKGDGGEQICWGLVAYCEDLEVCSEYGRRPVRRSFQESGAGECNWARVVLGVLVAWMGV